MQTLGKESSVQSIRDGIAVPIPKTPIDEIILASEPRISRVNYAAPPASLTRRPGSSYTDMRSREIIGFSRIYLTVRAPRLGSHCMVILITRHGCIETSSFVCAVSRSLDLAVKCYDNLGIVLQLLLHGVDFRPSFMFDRNERISMIRSKMNVNVFDRPRNRA